MKSKKRDRKDKRRRHEEKHKKTKRRHRRRSSSSSESSTSRSPRSLSRSPVRNKSRVEQASSSPDSLSRKHRPPLSLESSRFPTSSNGDMRKAANGAYAANEQDRRRRRRSSSENEIVSFTYSRPTVGPTRFGAADETELPRQRGSTDHSARRTHSSGFSDSGFSVGDAVLEKRNLRERDIWRGDRGRRSQERGSTFSQSQGKEDASALAASAYELKTYHRAFGLDVGGYAFVGEEEALPLSNTHRGEGATDSLQDAIKAGAAASLLHGSLVQVKKTERHGTREKTNSKTHPHLFWQCWSCGADNYKTRHQCFKCKRLFAL
ncbi:hypothetical protein TGMAS_251790 [Toxoplasma gondii MAS]|uniref:RanBP2-type domain-containing protein n=2 Tax=Toxoplasma gondii TaxID=5811 RepID=A0A086PWK1_TOXGO|nr:hypothetical protein TGMAS_251790 [Toxoplasma gondii MAS]PUA83842.1 hypothetical protein TGBR9_251790 [Toxoplasma gondii TgCATBr9]